MTIRYLAGAGSGRRHRTRATSADKRAIDAGASIPAKDAPSGTGPSKQDASKPIRKRLKRSKCASAREAKRDFKSS